MLNINALYIDWMPDVELFSIGAFSVRWYSFLWCVGLLLAYLIVRQLYRQQKIEEEKFEPLFFYCFLGVLIGARLGHCLFYEPSYYLGSLNGFIEMLIPFRQTADGAWKFTGYEGLASHGGTIGLMISLAIYCRKTKLPMWNVLDDIAIAVPVTSACIRLGNLMNSEIIGKQTDVAWAFIFHSRESLVDGMAVPRHPAQLYEAIAYISIFIIGWSVYRRWKKGMKADSPIAVGSGFYFGFCLVTIFSFRFFVEFLKKEQVDFELSMLLNMGQELSIPFVIIGAICLLRAKKGWGRKRQ